MDVMLVKKCEMTTHVMFFFQEAPHVALNQNLTDVLDAAPGKCVQYVITTGTPPLLQVSRVP